MPAPCTASQPPTYPPPSPAARLAPLALTGPAWPCLQLFEDGTSAVPLAVLKEDVAEVAGGVEREAADPDYQQGREPEERGSQEGRGVGTDDDTGSEDGPVGSM